jgi:hypothetical protein
VRSGKTNLYYESSSSAYKIFTFLDNIYEIGSCFIKSGTLIGKKDE